MGRISSRQRLIFSAGAVGVVAVAAVVAWFTLLQPAQATPTIARPGGPAPQIALPVVGGGMSNLEADRGKVVLVNFWATWCEPCKSEMPGLQQLADELRDQPFRLYSVDLQEEASAIEAFERDYGLRLYAVMDLEGDATRAYGVRALPSTFLIDQRGTLHVQRLGPLLAGGPETTWSEAWLADQVRSLISSS
jgi:thiol-disulfide isomerase/thioredoxin